MEGYQIQTELPCFEEGGIRLFEARRDFNKERALVLRFPRSESVDISIYHNAVQVVNQLRGRDMLLALLDARIESSSESEFSFSVSYEWGHSFKRWTEVDRHGLWIMSSAVEILDDLFRGGHLSGEFLGKQMIFVDEEKFSIQLGFIGLANVFRAHNVGAQVGPADRGDDVYNLAQCFKGEISDSSSEVIRNCLDEEKAKRPGYPELLRDIKKDSSFRPDYPDEVSLLCKNNNENIERLIGNFNLYDCHISPWIEKERGERKKRVCSFQTIGFKGKFINTEGDRHFFVPWFDKLASAPTGEILRAKFTRATNSTRNDNGKYHHLVALRAKKDRATEEWRIVPKKQKEFIEETAFNARYCHVREVDSRVKKFSFLLQDDEMNWPQVENLKQKQKQLEAVPMLVKTHNDHSNVGIVDDITKGRLIIGVKSRKKKNTLRRKGELWINSRLDIPFDFYYRDQDDQEKFFFVACDIDVESVRENLCKDLKKRDSVDVSIIGQSGVFGDLTEGEIKILPEIITRDAKVEHHDISLSGELQENTHLETIPYKRQIDAVDQFTRGDICCNPLCGILATPSEHKPIIVQSTEPKWRNEELDETQKKAVVFALHQKPLFLINGPPGTGKTTVIVEIVHQILAANPQARILVCSQTNLAVDNVIERLPEEKEGQHGVVRKVRLVSQAGADKISSSVQPFVYDRLLRKWVTDVIQRSSQEADLSQNPSTSMARAWEKATHKQVEFNQAQKNAIQSVVKKWHAFLRVPEKENCKIRSYASQDGWLPLKTAFLKSRNVIGSTCVHIATSRYREVFHDSYDCVLIDEASKATPAETIIPIVRAKQVILIGDHKQLPPFVTNEREVWEKVQGENSDLEDVGIEDLRRKFGESLFESLASEFSELQQLQSCFIMLEMQRRMSEKIGDLISKHFYDGKLKTPNDEEYRQNKQLGLPFKKETSLIFINTSVRDNCHDNDRIVWRENQCNADVVVETLQCLSQRLTEKSNVAVIAGYRGQVDLLRKSIRRVDKRDLNKLTFDVSTDVSTVDAFQGRENAIVIYDVVRSSKGSGSIGFLDEPRRLNVALSRAQKLLIIVGNADFLINRACPAKNREAEKPILGEIAEEIRKQDCMFKSLDEALK